MAYWRCTAGKVIHSATDHTWSVNSAAIAGVRAFHRPSSPRTRGARTGRRKLSPEWPNHVAATCTSRSFENAAVFRTFRLHRPRSVPSCRPTNAAFATRHAADTRRASSNPAHVPNTGRVLTDTARPFARASWTAARVNPTGNATAGVRRVLVRRDEPRDQPARPRAVVGHRCAGQVGGAFADRQADHRPAVRVERHVVPAVPDRRRARFAAPLLAPGERPLPAGRDFTRRRGKKPRARRAAAGRDRRRRGRSG